MTEPFVAPDVCDQCEHPMTEHVLWPPDELCAGWMHCTVYGCTACWHEWPRVAVVSPPRL